MKSRQYLALGIMLIGELNGILSRSKSSRIVRPATTNERESCKPAQQQINNHRIGQVDKKCTHQWHDHKGPRRRAQRLGDRRHIGYRRGRRAQGQA